MVKSIRLKLQPIKDEPYDIEEMTVILSGENIGEIVSVYPESLSPDYADLSVWIETCKEDHSPVLFTALGMYNIQLPCIVQKITVGEDYPCLCRTCKYLQVGGPRHICQFYHKHTLKNKTCGRWHINANYAIPQICLILVAIFTL